MGGIRDERVASDSPVRQPAQARSALRGVLHQDPTRQARAPSRWAGGPTSAADSSSACKLDGAVGGLWAAIRWGADAFVRWWAKADEWP